MSQAENIVAIVLRHYPSAQAIYLFGSYATEDERGDSDVDIAILLPHSQSAASLMLSDCRFALEDALGRTVDLLSARSVATVFQKEIVEHGRLLFCGDEDAKCEFEFMTLSLYQKLNEERREILEDFALTGKAYNV
ncbi:MAG: type VII toxin-antitoxin system MntA family adenylyltransferase antitoxin [Fimbriimonas sp.]